MHSPDDIDNEHKQHVYTQKANQKQYRRVDTVLTSSSLSRPCLFTWCLLFGCLVGVCIACWPVGGWWWWRRLQNLICLGCIRVDSGRCGGPQRVQGVGEKLESLRHRRRHRAIRCRPTSLHSRRHLLAAVAALTAIDHPALPCHAVAKATLPTTASAGVRLSCCGSATLPTDATG